MLCKLVLVDNNGCVGQSPATFNFDFCVDIKGLPDPQDCQSTDILAKVKVIPAASSRAVQCDWHFSLFGNPESRAARYNYWRPQRHLQYY